MNLAILIAVFIFLIWIITIKHADKIGEVTKKFIIDPIKGLFE